MDPSKSTPSPELQPRDASIESSTTRPNPFDESESAARKRRRMSGLPSKTAEALNSDDHSDSSGSATIDADVVEVPANNDSDSAMNVDLNPAMAQTPEKHDSPGTPPAESASSKCTINLRNALLGDGHDVPVAPLEHLPEQPHTTGDHQDGASAPDAVDLIEISDQSGRTSRSSSGSPRVEFIAISDDEESPVNPSILAGDLGAIDGSALSDPIDRFPYRAREANEPVYETAHRVVDHLANHPSPDPAILANVNIWLSLYLHFARHGNSDTVMASHPVHEQFWNNFSDTILALMTKRPPIYTIFAHQQPALDFMAQFARLSGQFIRYDILRMQQCANLQEKDRNLYSVIFLRKLCPVLSHVEPAEAEENGVSAMGTGRTQEALIMLDHLDAECEGTISRLLALIDTAAQTLAEYPRCLHSLNSICQFLVLLVQAERDGFWNSKPGPSPDRVHETCDRISKAFCDLVENRIGLVNKDYLSGALEGLQVLQRTCMLGKHSQAVKLSEDYQLLHPEFPPELICDILSMQWTLKVENKLIRDGHMHVRVAATERMACQLVATWQQFSNQPSHPYLLRTAEFLVELGLVDYLLGPSCHPEIVIHSSNIVGFLVVTKTYTEEHINQLWQGITASQDTRVCQAVAQLIQPIIRLFDYDGLLQLCDRFQTLPIEAFTSTSRMLWLGMMDNVMSKCQQERRSPTYEPYACCLRLLRDSSTTDQGLRFENPALQKLVREKFQEFTSMGLEISCRERIYDACFEDLSAKSTTTLGSLWALCITIGAGRRADELRVLCDERNLTAIAIAELEHSASVAKEHAFPILSGEVHVPRQRLIHDLIVNQALDFGTDIGRRLWDVLVGSKSSCGIDRDAGWEILITITRRVSTENEFVQLCSSHYLPTLSSEFWSAGAYEFVRLMSIALISKVKDFALEEKTTVETSCIEQLWRLIMQVEDKAIMERAVITLASEVYTHQKILATYSLERIYQVQSSLVDRCFRQLQKAACNLAAHSPNDQDGEDKSMPHVASDLVSESRSMFVRSLRVLRCFLEAQQLRSPIATPISSLSLKTPKAPPTPPQVEGEPTQLKYQSFDGEQQTAIKSLTIGRQNTARCLLNSISQETGFEHYRVYYRGGPFVPTEEQLCQSLFELNLDQGLILIKREEGNPSGSLKAKVMAHFDEMWKYLVIDHVIASEIYDFMIFLPPHEDTVNFVCRDVTSYTDLFPSGEPYRILYFLHVLMEFNKRAKGRHASQDEVTSVDATRKQLLSFIAKALESSEILPSGLAHLQIQLAHSLITSFMALLNSIEKPIQAASVGLNGPSRLIEVMQTAHKSEEPLSIPLASKTLQALLTIGSNDSEFWKRLITEEAFFTTFRDMILVDERIHLRQAVEKIIVGFLHGEDNKGTSPALSDSSGVIEVDGPRRIVDYYLSITPGLLPLALEQSKSCLEFFHLCQALLQKSLSNTFSAFNCQELALKLSQLLLEARSTEEIGHRESLDAPILGIASIFLTCLQMCPSLASHLSNDLAPQLLSRHLLPPLTAEGDEVAKVVLNSDTRYKIYQVLFQLIKDDGERLHAMIKSLGDEICPIPIQSNEEHAYLYELPYNFDRNKALKAPRGYTGLRNLSNTCYLNSLITQLFMNVDFRQFMLSARIVDPEDRQRLLHRTAQLFSFMQETYRRSIEPVEFVSAIKTYEETMIDIHNQMDVDEFYNLIFDRWEGQFFRPDDRKALRSFYGGQLVQQVKSRECDHISERLEPFSAIQCDIKGKTTLEESLQDYVDGEVLEGDNKYKCSDCDRHVNAVKRSCFKDLHDSVIFHLKRFDFNLKTFIRSKINDYFSFPKEIDLAPYTAEYAQNPELAEKDMYELCGVILHTGTAESGHYYSFIRERPSGPEAPRWMEFNDENVSEWDPADLEAATFGGLDQTSAIDGNTITMEKPYSAYMLFYVRSSSLQAQQGQGVTETCQIPMKLDIDPMQRKRIQDENAELLRRHCLFDNQHTRFVESCLSQAFSFIKDAPSNPESTNLASKLGKQAATTTVAHFDQIITRTKDLPLASPFGELMKESIESTRDGALAFLTYLITYPIAFRSMLQRNPEVSVRRYIGTKFVGALRRVAWDFPRLYAEDDGPSSELSDAQSIDKQNSPRAILDGALQLLEYTWRYFPIHIRAWEEYFETVLNFAQLGNRETLGLLQHNWLTKVAMMITADPNLPNLRPSYLKMLQNVHRRANNRAPSYNSIIKLIAYLLEQLDPLISAETIVSPDEDRLGRQQAPFPWQDDEVSFFHDHPLRQGCSFFLEKLINLHQCNEGVDSILIRLMHASESLDAIVAKTLQSHIREESVVGVFLRAAMTYMKNTKFFNSALSMVEHTANQAPYLDDADGRDLCHFFNEAMSLRRAENDEDESDRIHLVCLNNVDEWGPCLVMHKEYGVRLMTADLLDRVIFRYSPNRDNGAADIEMIQADEQPRVELKVLVTSAKRLGRGCLSHARNVYIDPQVRVVRPTAEAVVNTISKCQPFFEVDTDDLSKAEAEEYEEMLNSTIEQLRILAIDEVEEDVSDWEGSFASSEHIDGVTEMSVQTAKEVKDD